MAIGMALAAGLWLLARAQADDPPPRKDRVIHYTTRIQFDEAPLTAAPPVDDERKPLAPSTTLRGAADSPAGAMPLNATPFVRPPQPSKDRDRDQDQDAEKDKPSGWGWLADDLQERQGSGPSARADKTPEDDPEENLLQPAASQSPRPGEFNARLLFKPVTSLSDPNEENPDDVLGNLPRDNEAIQSEARKKFKPVDLMLRSGRPREDHPYADDQDLTQAERAEKRPTTESNLRTLPTFMDYRENIGLEDQLLEPSDLTRPAAPETRDPPKQTAPLAADTRSPDSPFARDTVVRETIFGNREEPAARYGSAGFRDPAGDSAGDAMGMLRPPNTGYELPTTGPGALPPSTTPGGFMPAAQSPAGSMAQRPSAYSAGLESNPLKTQLAPASSVSMQPFGALEPEWLRTR